MKRNPDGTYIVVEVMKDEQTDREVEKIEGRAKMKGAWISYQPTSKQLDLGHSGRRELEQQISSSTVVRPRPDHHLDGSTTSTNLSHLDNLDLNNPLDQRTRTYLDDILNSL